LKGLVIKQSGGAPNPFNEALSNISMTKKSRLILALDLDHRKDTSCILSDAKKIVESTSDCVCAIKINHHLMLPLSIHELSSLNKVISENGLVSIADLKLNDIDNTNRVATEYLWDAGFSAVIVNPFVGFEGALDVVFDRARELSKGVITLAYMSHKGADEGYGLRLTDRRTMFDEFLERAKKWGAAGIILGTTRPEKIKTARKFLGKEVKIICPGSGAQGGDAMASIKAGADYLIFGRTIVESEDARTSAKKVLQSLSLRANHQPP
jgi:orotidine-5'-phosphate decarboxylase